MNRRLLWWLTLLPLMIVVVFIVGYTWGEAHADPSDRVYVDATIEGHDRTAAQISDRLREGDELRVIILPLGGVTNEPVTGSTDTLLLAIGDEVTVHANGWPDQVYADGRLDLINNVSRDPVDQIMALIRDIHSWQDTHAKPVPPAPPQPPGPPLDLTWLWWAAPTTVLVVAWAVLHIRYIRRRNRLRRDAEEQVDWDLDRYGITTDLK